MNVALFGGTFDPVHLGHIAVARAAQQRFGLSRIYLVPADVPPHKHAQPITPYHHRYAMLALATQGEKDLIPSLLEAPDQEGHPHYGANYSIDTVRRFKTTLKKSDRLFFLIGIDAFLEIASWRDPEQLLRECEFIVVSRPGYSLADVAGALPESMRPSREVLKPFQKATAQGDIVLAGAVIHLLEGVEEKVSATQTRHAAASGRALNRWVSRAVADYIKKTGLYRKASKGRPKNEAEILQEEPPRSADHRNSRSQEPSSQVTPASAGLHTRHHAVKNLQLIQGGSGTKRRKAARPEER